jgi:hypothetical protein
MMTPLNSLLCAFVVTLGILAQASPAWSIALGQIDDFQDGTKQGWGSGVQNPNPPVVAFDAGPDGVGDDALQITSTGGFGPGSRLVGFNMTQWTGDYLTTGVETIVVDVNNVGSTALNLRLAIDGAGGRFASTVAVPLGVGSGWQTVILSIFAADLTSAGGLNVNLTLSGMTQLRLISAASPSFMGDSIAAQLLVDNVEALPEPSKPVLLLAGSVAVLILGRRRARRAAGAAEHLNLPTRPTPAPASR